ncbi:MAG TPA: hypothetical protein EYN66_16450, partial [Myxococcales bacterium]|nr:hypothetical protein [Myxococcales bacterium]
MGFIETCSDTVCVDGVGCQKGCKGDSDCLGDKVCVGGGCVAKQDNGDTCSEDKMCVSGRCAADKFCCADGSVECCKPGNSKYCGDTSCVSETSIEKTVCNATSFTCADTGDGGSCDSTKCIKGACLKSCKTSTDCVGGKVCISGQCGGKLPNGEGCSSGASCDSGYCDSSANICCTDNDAKCCKNDTNCAGLKYCSGQNQKKKTCDSTDKTCTVEADNGQCNSEACNTDTGLCYEECTHKSHCVEGYGCDKSNKDCVNNSLDNGEYCFSDDDDACINECMGGYCCNDQGGDVSECCNSNSHCGAFSELLEVKQTSKNTCYTTDNCTSSGNDFCEADDDSNNSSSGGSAVTCRQGFKADLSPGTSQPPPGVMSKAYLSKVDIFVKYGGQGTLQTSGTGQKYYISSAKLKIYGPKTSFSSSLGSHIATSEATVSSTQGWHYDSFH